MNENRDITRNKAKLVTQGYSKEERIEFEETYTSMVRFETIRILLIFIIS